MNIDKIKVNKIYTFKKRKDVDLVSTFLEKKYCKKINFTLFGGNKVIFVTGNDIMQKVYLNDSDVFDYNQAIFDDIINYNIFSSKDLRKKLIHGIYYESENSFSIMKIKLSENIIKEKNIRTIFRRIFSENEGNSSELKIELSLLEFLNIYFVDIKNVHKRMFIDDIVDIFIKIFQYQNGKHNFYFNKEYFLKYHDISIS